MAKFIILPNGEAIRTDAIIAVRKFDGAPARHGNEERDALASSIMAQIIANQ